MPTLTEISKEIDRVMKPVRDAAKVITLWPEYQAVASVKKIASDHPAFKALVNRMEKEGLSKENMAPVLTEIMMQQEVQATMARIA